MSFTEPTADAGQPAEGQAAEAPSQPYADYLNRVPEEVRGDIQPIFHDWNSQVNRQFEEHANYRKQWEPYESIGLNQHQPDQVQWAMQVAEAAQNNPQALREYLDQQHGPVQVEQPQQNLDEFAYQDPQQQWQDQLAQQLKPLQEQLQQFSDWRTALEQQAHQAQIEQAISTEVERLKQENASSLPKHVLENFDNLVSTFAERHAEAGDPRQAVQKGWADLQTLLNQTKTDALQAKLDQPAPSLEGGVADLAPDQPKTLREAQAIALQQMRANRVA